MERQKERGEGDKNGKNQGVEVKSGGYCKVWWAVMTSYKPQTFPMKNLDLVQWLSTHASESFGKFDCPCPTAHMLNFILSGMGPRHAHLGKNSLRILCRLVRLSSKGKRKPEDNLGS